MKHLTLLTPLLVALFSAPAFGVANAKVNTASTNLLGAYDTDAPQKTMTNIVNATHLAITNETAGRICCHPKSAAPNSAPTGGDGAEICVPGNAIKAWDGINISGALYCRSDTGASITSGVFIVEVWQ